MGGSRSSGWTPSAPSSTCQRLRLIATVNSPDPTVLSGLQIGDVLFIRLEQALSIAIVHTADADVGSLTGPKVPGLIECLRKGFEYEASITKILKGQLEVEVAHV